MNIFHDHKCESKPWYIPLGSLHNSLQMNVNLPKISKILLAKIDPQIMLVPYQSISLKIFPKNTALFVVHIQTDHDPQCLHWADPP